MISTLIKLFTEDFYERRKAVNELPIQPVIPSLQRPTALRWKGLELLTFKQLQKMNRITNAQNVDVSPAIVKQVLVAGFRYVVNISFKGFTEVGFKKVENIAEPVKTLKEAQEYKALVDDTVSKACIVDMVKGKVVEWWVQ